MSVVISEKSKIPILKFSHDIHKLEREHGINNPNGYQVQIPPDSDITIPQSIGNHDDDELIPLTSPYRHLDLQFHGHNWTASTASTSDTIWLQTTASTTIRSWTIPEINSIANTDTTWINNRVNTPLVRDRVARRKPFKNNHLVENEIPYFKKDLPRKNCCFNPSFQPYSWYNEIVRAGEGLDPCRDLPTRRMFSPRMGVSLDYCEAHYPIAIDWHLQTQGKMPTMCRKFTDKELKKAVELRYEEEVEEAHKELRRQQKEQERILAQEGVRKKADELLQKWLSPDEYNSLKMYDKLDIPSPTNPNILYEVKKDVGKKVVKKIREKIGSIYIFKRIEELCIMPLESDYVNDDNLLAKILLLKTDEKEFLEIANHYPLVRS